LVLVVVEVVLVDYTVVANRVEVVVVVAAQTVVAKVVVVVLVFLVSQLVGKRLFLPL
jgi:hypothetical protein